MIKKKKLGKRSENILHLKRSTDGKEKKNTKKTLSNIYH